MLNGKIKDLFTISGGNSGLTEELIYNNQPLNEEDAVSVYSGSTIEGKRLKSVSSKIKLVVNGRAKDLKWFEKGGILIIRKGKAGKLRIVNDDKYTINDDAYVLTVKRDFATQIDLHFLLLYLKGIVKQCVSSDGEGKNGTFNKTLFEQMFINLPDIDEQRIISDEVKHLYYIEEFVSHQISAISKVLSKVPSTNCGDYEYIGVIFDLISEDRRLTEEYVYRNQGIYPIYSAQKYGAFGYINEYKINGEIISVVQYGDAGKVFYRKGVFNLGRNACGLVPKSTYKDRINLKYMKYSIEQALILNTKGEGLKSLNQDTIKRTLVYIPHIEEQDKLVYEYEKLEVAREKLEEIKIKISNVIK